MKYKGTLTIYLLWEDAEDITFSEIIRQATNEYISTVAILLMPGGLTADAKLCFSFIDLVDVLHVG